MSLPTTYYKLESLEDNQILTILSSDQIPLDENIQSFIIQRNELENIPSTSNDMTYYIEDVKQEPEMILPDLVIPPSNVEEIHEIIEEEQAMDVYEITRNPQGELECPVCRANFKIIANLERHIQIHAKKFVFEIPKNSNSPKAVDGPPKLLLYRCEFCTCKFEYKRHLTRHVLADHKPKKKNFEPMKSLTVDLKLKQNPDVLKCKECPAEYKTVKDMKVHEKVHQKEKNKCEQCEKSFKTRKLMKTHCEKHHQEDN